MKVKPIKPRLVRYLQKNNLSKKFQKQVALLEIDPRYPSLNTERLEPKKLRLYSFRIDRKYRAIFIMTKGEKIEIIDVNNHYE